jgi:hypothetical protein
VSIQIIFENKTLALIQYKNYNHIIVIDKPNENIIPTYFVSNENNSCQMTAYYSLFDTDYSVSTRNEDWCKIIDGIKTSNFNLLIPQSQIHIPE